MKISENWLRESVDLSGISRALLLEKLTAAGLEVEACDPVAPDFAGVRVAQILSAEKHPDAERLRVCVVDTGQEKLQIVCGAPNARVGLKAPLAMVGAVLPGGLQIKVGKLRGVESFGMLCSATELGLPAQNDGLLELPESAVVGQNIRECLDLDDAVIELKMTPNRSDCLGVAGLVRELQALFGRAALRPHAEPLIPELSDALTIKLDDAAACPRYLGQVVRGINPSAVTPDWLKEKLRRSGLRAIHPVVDITNFVLLELGQPMHGFDLSAIEGGITVRRAQAGETLKLLDEQQATLDEQFLVIADNKKALAVAGVMGGFDSRVHAASTDIFFEAAHFAPSVIMGRARKLGLHTDSSHRFERGVDVQLPALALARATRLLIDIAGGKAGPVITAESTAHLPVQAEVNLRQARLLQALGIAVPDAKVEQILRDLGFGVKSSTEGWTVTPHSARFDIAIEEDLIEEVARVFGYEHIPVKLPMLALAPLLDTETQRPDGDVRRLLAARDYQEAITFTFSSSLLLEKFGLKGHPILNPLSADIDVMRPSLMPNLLTAVLQNQRRQIARVRLFELGVAFLDEGRSEPQRIAFVATGTAVGEQWGVTVREVDFYDVKGDVEALLAATGRLEQLHYRPSSMSYLHPGRSADIYLGDTKIGYLGQLHPQTAGALDLKNAPFVAELALDAVLTRAMPKPAALSKFPSTRRDLAIVVPEAVPFVAIQKLVQSCAGPVLQCLECFDVYRGNGVAEGHKSLAIGLILQDASRTLSDIEVDELIARVVAALGERLHGSLRS